MLALVGWEIDIWSVRNNLWTWQDLSPDSGPGADFFNFCDALEVKNGVSAPASGWGLDHALTAWGNYWTSGYLQDREWRSKLQC